MGRDGTTRSAVPHRRRCSASAASSTARTTWRTASSSACRRGRWTTGARQSTARASSTTVRPRRQQVSLREYWTLARSSIDEDARWILISIEQQAEGDHHLDSDIVATPWGDDKRLTAAATLTSSRPRRHAVAAGFTTADLVDPDFAEDVRAAALDLSLVDARFGPDVHPGVRHAVRWRPGWRPSTAPTTRWRALATPEAIRALLHPGDAAPGPDDPPGRPGGVVRRTRSTCRRLGSRRPSRHGSPSRSPRGGRRYIEDRDTGAAALRQPEHGARVRRVLDPLAHR